MATLRLRNNIQKALFEEELRGQLSDGYWENAGPREHWKPWCNATIVVDPHNVGRDFPVNRDRYGFSSPLLLSYVGGRMLLIAQRFQPSFTMRDLRRELREISKIVKIYLH